MPGALRVGLLGGSFNPAHSGHRAISLAAIEALGLDEVWWLVSPGNPLKDKATDMAPFAVRFASARKMAGHAPIRVSAIETRLGTRYTVDTLAKVQALYQRIDFAMWRQPFHWSKLSRLSSPISQMKSIRL